MLPGLGVGDNYSAVQGDIWLTYVCRGDLENERVKKEYERGYQTLLDFYHKYF